MTFKKSMRLGISTTPLMLKSVLCQAIIIALILGLLLLIVSPVVQDLLALLEQVNIQADLDNLITQITDNADSTAISTSAKAIIDDILELFNIAGNLFSSIIWTYVGVILSLIFYRFLLSIIDYPVMASLTDFMQTSSSKSFIWYFVKKLGRGCLFSICQFACVVWLDMFVFFGTIGFYLLILSPMRVVGVIFAVVMFILAYSVRVSFYSAWLPEYVVNGGKIFNALARSFTFAIKRFWKICYKVAVVITSMFVLSIGLEQLLALINCPPFVISVVTALVSFYGFYFIKCIGAVEYFEAQGKPYFTKHVKITADTDLDAITIA